MHQTVPLKLFRGLILKHNVGKEKCPRNWWLSNDMEISASVLTATASVAVMTLAEHSGSVLQVCLHGLKRALSVQTFLQNASK